MSDAHARGAQLLTRETQLTEVGALAVTDGETALHAHERGDLQAGLHLLLVLFLTTEATELTRRDIGGIQIHETSFFVMLRSGADGPTRFCEPGAYGLERPGGRRGRFLPPRRASNPAAGRGGGPGRGKREVRRLRARAADTVGAAQALKPPPTHGGSPLAIPCRASSTHLPPSVTCQCHSGGHHGGDTRQ